MKVNFSNRNSSKRSVVILEGRVRWDAFSQRQKHVALELSKYRDVIYLEDGGPLFPKCRRVSPTIIVVSGILRWYDRNFRKPSTLVLSVAAGYLNLLTIKYEHVIIWAMENCHELLPGVRAKLRVFDHIDPCFSDNPNEIESFNIRVINMASKANVVFATAPALLEECKPYNSHCYLVENATPVKNIAVTDLRDIDLVWLGTLDSRLDYKFLAELASTQKGIRMVLAGNIHPDYRSIVRSIPNVDIVGPLSDSDGDALLARSRYGAIPYTAGPISDRVNPCKIFSYIASGVVPISLPSTHAIRFSDYCLMSSDVQYWLSAIEQNSYPSRWSERDLFVSDHTWFNRVQFADNILTGLLHGTKPIG